MYEGDSISFLHFAAPRASEGGARLSVNWVAEYIHSPVPGDLQQNIRHLLEAPIDGEWHLR